MKIVCGSCGAKYSIADEKVQGKVFKIRCRKCSNTIVVKGTQGEGLASFDDAQEGAASHGGSTGAQEWHAVIGDEQSSAMSAEELEAYFYAGQIQADTYIWKDGMVNWDSLSNVPTFAHLVQGGAMAGLGYGEASGAPLMQGPDEGYAQRSALNDAAEYGPPVSGHQTYGSPEQEEEDATAIVDAKQWRAQQDAEEAAAAAAVARYDAPLGEDPTAAFPRPEGGWDEGLDDAGMDPTSQGLFSNDAYANDFGGGGHDFGSSNVEEFGAGSEELVGGGTLNYNAGTDFGGSSDPGLGTGEENDNLFNTFDADLGNAGGIAYQSFSGIGAAPSDLDLGAAIGQASSDPGYGNASKRTPEGFGLGTNGSPSAESPELGYESQDGLIGTRNENSVLFSLSSLQQVNAVGGGLGGSGASKDVPLTDGSGLIDLQSLAATHSQLSGPEGAGLPSALGAHAPAGEPFSPSTMSLPAIMPRGTHRDNKPLFLGLIAAVVLLAGAGVAAAVIISSKAPDENPVKIIERVVEKTPDNSGEQLAQNQEVASELEQIKKQLAEQKAAAAAAAAAPEEEEEEEEKTTSKRGSSQRVKRSSASSRRDDKPSSEGSKPSSSKKSNDGINSILERLDNPKEKETKEEKSAPAPASDSKVPKKLDRLVVRNTIAQYTGRIKGCGKTSNSGNLSGSIGVGMKVSPDGRVTSADLKTSKFEGTDVGKCVLGVVRSIKFPPAQESLTISKYPFML